MSQIVHHVFFWLKDFSNSNNILELKAGIKTLEAIDTVQQLIIGGPASTLKRDVVDNSYHVSELMFFNSLADQQSYQSHPVHAAFVAKYSHLWQKVLVYDMLTDI